MAIDNLPQKPLPRAPDLSSFWDHPRHMEPLWPVDANRSLWDTAVVLIRESAALGAALHPLTRDGVLPMLRTMNSYYSNLIEGHVTLPRDIERALAGDYSRDPAKRALQQEAAAHVELEALMMRRLEAGDVPDPCSPEFLRWLHRSFHGKRDEEFHVVRSPSGREMRLVPGELRHDEVTVGAHHPPRSSALPAFLEHFDGGYDPRRLNAVQKVLAAAASHHRFVWIHPFLDGNGRVGRLFTTAMLRIAGVDAGGLWSIARGMARTVKNYRATLMAADIPRQGDLDGRGNLSDEGLTGFCRYFLVTALDQVRYIRELLDLDSLQSRILAYGRREIDLGTLPKGSDEILRQAFLRGELSRGDLRAMLVASERRAASGTRRGGAGEAQAARSGDCEPSVATETRLPELCRVLLLSRPVSERPPRRSHIGWVVPDRIAGDIIGGMARPQERQRVACVSGMEPGAISEYIYANYS
jgi:Fic family protein